MKRKHHEDHVNHEAWAIPYADLMTLLLAFFVVMYAVSVVNEGKYRVMSESIIEAFNGSSHVIAPMPAQKARPHNVDPAIAAPQGQPGAAVAPVAVPLPLRPAPRRMVARRAPHETLRDVQAAEEAQRQANLTRIQGEVEKALQPLIDKQQVVVRRTRNWLEIEIRTDILFPSGVAQLSHQADAVLSSLGGILAPFGNPLRIEGYTDDKPINTAVFPSNWELSAARAASVARLFTEHGVSPTRLGIIGWGQFRPAADNATSEGRNRNRRVLVVVLSDHATPTRYSDDADRIGQLAGHAPPSPPAGSMSPLAGLAGDAAPGNPGRAAAPPVESLLVEPPLVVKPAHGK
ncbi:MAG TPA: flagellar motor protein MotD [Frateuria sp.]|uniref:flagellar motor protein MotD n=1 Tax=Frateuria sp. TaxID=2211372 RepID=UPI002D7F4BE2|nr:flagellar motor protein MotD [Frateuria sp.]HET6804073.1 flagellar motor protein MotD [Frateuria sp.]